MVLVSTFLYAVRNANSLQIKYGYETNHDLEDAKHHILSRYGSYYHDVDILHIVPVRVRGRDAEDALKTRMLHRWTHGEFLVFADEATMRTELAAVYPELACPEDEAFKKTSCRESKEAREARRSAREETRAVVSAAAIAASKRRAEDIAAREAIKCARRDVPRGAAKVKLERLQAHEGIHKWAAACLLEADEAAFVTLETLRNSLRRGMPECDVGPRVLKARLESLYPRHSFKEKHTVAGVRHNTVMTGVRLMDM